MPRVTENDAHSHKTRDEKCEKNKQAANDPFAPIPVETRNAENTIILDGNEDPEAPIRDPKRAREQQKKQQKTIKIIT